MNTTQWQTGEGNEYLSLDFARCQRPDGSYYGTGGQCRKGTPVGPREIKAIAKKAKDGDARAKKALEKMAADGDKDAKKALEGMGGAAKELKKIDGSDNDAFVEVINGLSDEEYDALEKDGFDKVEDQIENAKKDMRKDDSLLENDMDEAMDEIDGFEKGDQFYPARSALEELRDVNPGAANTLEDEYLEIAGGLNTLRDAQEEWANTMGGTSAAADDASLVGYLQGGWETAGGYKGSYDPKVLTDFGQKVAAVKGLEVDDEGAMKLAIGYSQQQELLQYNMGDRGFRRGRNPNPWIDNQEEFEDLVERFDSFVTKLGNETDAAGIDW